MSRPTSTEMRDVREQLLSIEQKYKRLKQQQFIFTTALERSREDARDKTEPVSTVSQVIFHCITVPSGIIFSNCCNNCLNKSELYINNKIVLCGNTLQ